MLQLYNILKLFSYFVIITVVFPTQLLFGKNLNNSPRYVADNYSLHSGLVYPLAPYALETIQNAQFVTCTISDEYGRILVGTEDEGLFICDHSMPNWKYWQNYKAFDGMCDNTVTAITVDKLGRIWVGTNNHGVSIFNGKKWRNYDVLSGIVGSHIFALGTNPVDGDIWIATSGGVNRYCYHTGKWLAYTKADGLASDLVNAVGFTKYGDVILGCQADGLIIGRRDNDYRKWKQIKASNNLSFASSGDGIPSNLINCITVSPEGTIYAGTNSGIAISDNNGIDWYFIRGRDWRDNASNNNEQDDLLNEDYITSLAIDTHKHIVIGYRQHGFEIRTHDCKHTIISQDDARYVSGIVPIVDGHILTFFYNDVSLIQGSLSGDIYPPLACKSVPKTPPDFPHTQPNPSLADLKILYNKLIKLHASENSSTTIIESLSDDWVTQGTWLDRYGDYVAILANMGGGGNDLVRGYRGGYIDYRPWLGTHGGANDYLRYWVSFEKSDNAKALQDPLFGLHKQSEWDDHGEEKSWSLNGPGIYCTLQIPKGHFILSLYNVNKDGHTGVNLYRDYVVTVKPTPMNHETFLHLGYQKSSTDSIIEDQFEDQPIQAKSRIYEFWEGVWKRFYVENHNDSGYITICINRNHSFNTILAGVFLDSLDIQSPVIYPYKLNNDRSDNIKLDGPSSDYLKLCTQLLHLLLISRDKNPEWYVLHGRSVNLTLMQALLNADAPEHSLAAKIEGHNRNEYFRRDIALCLRDLQLFNRAERIYVDRDRVLGFEWQQVTNKQKEQGWSINNVACIDEYAFWKYIQNAQKNEKW